MSGLTVVTVDVVRPVTDLEVIIPQSSLPAGGEVSHAVAAVVELAAVGRVTVQAVRCEADLCLVTWKHQL